MTAAFLLSLVLAAGGCLGMLLAGRGMWQGWAVGLVMQPLWAVFAIATGSYGLLLTCLMYGTVFGRNLYRSRQPVCGDPCRNSDCDEGCCAVCCPGLED